MVCVLRALFISGGVSMADETNVKGAWLRALREFSHATLLEGGRVAGVSCATMSNRERGFGEFSDQQSVALENFYNERIAARLARITKSLEPDRS
jgi:hypothetical protein